MMESAIGFALWTGDQSAIDSDVDFLYHGLEFQRASF